ncbi:MAG: EAL domain-containing protein [Acidimicrobiales bacterium]|nr:EAL domain-containing protein [Hyphomonadaceae bacterium]RZV44914.1 MAG: EAL domain-containing protein [Acidimicrobiales bacterium]
MADIQTAHGFRTHVSQKRYSVMRQPVVETKSKKVLHHEWLVRFDSKTGLERVLRPAEISGAISDLDLSMLLQAVEKINEKSNNVPIAINLSGASFSDPDFEHALFDILAKLELDASNLIFELTETWHLKDLQPAIRLLNILRDRGHSLCLDDVGAGAASIRYLRAFPADWLKIDGAFVAGAAINDREKSVLKAIMGLKDDLGVRFIGEGIESQRLHDFAIEMGFDAIQGYIIGAPELEISS